MITDPLALWHLQNELNALHNKEPIVIEHQPQRQLKERTHAMIWAILLALYCLGGTVVIGYAIYRSIW